MLPKSKRLTTNEVNEAMKKGRVFHSPLFFARALPVSSKGGISTVAPKKLAKTAVLRNKIRRLMYDSIKIRQSARDTKGIKNLAIVIVAKKDVSTSSREEIGREIDDLLQRVYSSGICTKQ